MWVRVVPVEIREKSFWGKVKKSRKWSHLIRSCSVVDACLPAGFSACGVSECLMVFWVYLCWVGWFPISTTLWSCLTMTSGAFHCSLGVWVCKVLWECRHPLQFNFVTWAAAFLSSSLQDPGASSAQTSFGSPSPFSVQSEKMRRDSYFLDFL